MRGQGGSRVTVTVKAKNKMCLSKYRKFLTLAEKPETPVLSAHPAKGFSAGLTLEASLALSLFIITVILIAIPIDMLDTQRRIQMTVESAAREAACAAPLLREKGGGEAGEAAEESRGANLLSSAAAQAYLYEKVRAAGGPKTENITVIRSAVRENGDEVDFRADYRIRLPFKVFVLSSVPFSARSRKHGWTGRDGKAGSGTSGGREEKMVYVGRDSTRYHVSPACHYISNEIHRIPKGSIAGLRNDAGRSYRPCRICGSAAASEYYVLPAGETYHTRADCSSLSYYVRQVPLSEAEHLGPCSYCAGGHG